MSPYDSKPGENSVPYAHLKIFSSNQVTLLPCCSLAALLKNLSALHDEDDKHIGNNSALTVRKIPSCSILNYKSIGAHWSASVKNSYPRVLHESRYHVEWGMVSEHIQRNTQLNKSQ